MELTVTGSSIFSAVVGVFTGHNQNKVQQFEMR
jgi:hypothetical protein